MTAQKEIKKIKLLLPDLLKTPALFFQDIDWQKRQAVIQVVQRDFYKKGIFLDHRAPVLRETGISVPLSAPWPILDQAWDRKFQPCFFIFHVSHCGSTLISLLLDEIEGVLSIREPLVLRPMAASENQFANGIHRELKDKMYEELGRLYILLSRRFKPDEKVIVKTTNICSSLGKRLLEFNENNRGLALKISLKSFLATMVMKAHIRDIESFSPHSLLGLKKHVPEIDLELAGLSRVQLLVINWLAVMLDFLELKENPGPTRVCFLDFDLFLANRRENLGKILRFFSLPDDAQTVYKLLESKVFLEYSKSPDKPFSPEIRKVILAESEKTNQDEIKEGLLFAEQLAKHEKISRALAFGEKPWEAKAS